MVNKEIEKLLLSLKDEALEATQKGDAEFYNNYLDDQAVAIVPFGIFDKKAIVQQMGSANSSFKSSKIEDTKAVVLSEDSGLVTYKATYETTKNDTLVRYSVFVTTVYCKINGQWKGVFYQQTPIQTKIN